MRLRILSVSASLIGAQKVRFERRRRWRGTPNTLDTEIGDACKSSRGQCAGDVRFRYPAINTAGTCKSTGLLSVKLRLPESDWISQLKAMYLGTVRWHTPGVS